MAAIQHKNIAFAIYRALKDRGNVSETEILKRAAKFLAKHRLLRNKKAILENLKNIINEAEDRQLVRLLTPTHASPHVKEKIAHTLSKVYKKDIVLEEVLEPNLLSGFRLETKDEVIDLSLKNRIKKLQEYLIA